MKVLFRRRNMIASGMLALAVVSLALITIGLISLKNKIDEEIENKPISISQLFLYPASLRSGLQKVLLQNGVKNVDDISRSQLLQANFRKPEENGYTESKWEIFSREGGQIDARNYPVQALVDNTESSTTAIISISNSLNGEKSSQNDLLFIIPNFKESSCKKVLSLGQKVPINEIESIPTLQSSPNLMEFPDHSEQGALFPKTTEKISGLKHSYGCAQFGGTYYYYYLIYAF